jgi:transcriptional regulator with XRE-family HTH domain
MPAPRVRSEGSQIDVREQNRSTSRSGKARAQRRRARALKDAGVEVSSSTIDRMEKGEILPRIDVAFGLAKLYGVQLDYLADDQMKTPPATAERNEELIWLLETMDELGFKEMKSRILRPGTTGP